MAGSLADMVLGFFEEECAFGTSRSDEGWESSAEGDENAGGAPAAKAFWESQSQLLQEAFLRISSTEARIRAHMEEALRKMRPDGASGNERRSCMLREIADWLRVQGYDSAVCKSKWRRSPEIPSGEHSYIDVLIASRSRPKDPARIVIEPSFRAEFEVARGSPEYNALVAQLPEIFVGKEDRMKSVVKLMCRAAKQCMKENRMHMGPWRKHEYMLSKWLGTCERLSAATLPSPVRTADARNGRQPRPRASMLTFDLHCTAVAVV